jgi:hypothetical protein
MREVNNLTLLPQMRTEDLDQTDLQRRDFAVPVGANISITRIVGHR